MASTSLVDPYCRIADNVWGFHIWYFDWRSKETKCIRCGLLQ